MARVEEARSAPLRRRLAGELGTRDGHLVAALLELPRDGSERGGVARTVECTRGLRVVVEGCEICLLSARVALDVLLEGLHVVGERDQILARGLLHLREVGLPRGAAPTAPGEDVPDRAEADDREP